MDIYLHTYYQRKLSKNDFFIKMIIYLKLSFIKQTNFSFNFNLILEITSRSPSRISHVRVRIKVDRT